MKYTHFTYVFEIDHFHDHLPLKVSHSHSLRGRKGREDGTYVPLYAARGFEGNWRVLRTETLHLHLYKSQTLCIYVHCTREYTRDIEPTLFSLDLLLNFTSVFLLLISRRYLQ